MTRRLLVALFIFSVVGPAWADSQERANALFVEAVQLTGKLNPDLSNAALGDKRQKLYEHSVLTLNKKLHVVPEWDESTIQERTAELFECALSLWPTPTAGD